jgi:hypothetical protein
MLTYMYADITLASVLSKCFPNESKARDLAQQGNTHLRNSRVLAARQVTHNKEKKKGGGKVIEKKKGNTHLRNSRVLAARQVTQYNKEQKKGGAK